jgi:hypothetical protein
MPVPSPGENQPNILDETMEGYFRLGAAGLKLLIKQMLNSDSSQILKLRRRIKGSDLRM